jgi:hypothetical protein
MQQLAPMLMLVCCVCCLASSIKAGNGIPTTPQASSASSIALMGVFTKMLMGGIF